MKDLDLLRYNILDEDYDNQNRIYLCHYDGINYSGLATNSNLSKVYNNGDTYERIYEMDEDNKIIKVIIKFYEKESNISYLCEKAINSNIVYKKADSVKTEEISKEEYEKLAKAFIKKNDILIFN
jgi:hypothetical protein